MSFDIRMEAYQRDERVLAPSVANDENIPEVSGDVRTHHTAMTSSRGTQNREQRVDPEVVYKKALDAALTKSKW